jgi:hypothetical protein
VGEDMMPYFLAKFKRETLEICEFREPGLELELERVVDINMLHW